MKVETRTQRATRQQRQLLYRNTPTAKRKKRAYDRKRYSHGLVRYSNWHKNHPIKSRRSRRDWFLKKTYGISLVDYNQLLIKQRRRCGVCNARHTTRRPLHVDHCHKTKLVRGLLCFTCNTALGKLGDSIRLVKKLVKYLEAPCV